MSCINFLIKGICGNHEAYGRNHFPQDTNITMFRKLDTFQGKITKTQTENQGKWIEIDNAYRFGIISDKIRKECSELWTKLNRGTKITFVATLICGIAGILAAVALSIIMPPLIPLAITVGILAAGVFGFSFVALHRSKQAAGQLKLWENPTPTFIKKCQIHHLQQIEEAKSKERAKQQFFASNRQYADQMGTKVHEWINEMKKIDEEISKRLKEPTSDVSSFLEGQIRMMSEDITKIEDEILGLQKLIEGEKNPEKLNEIKAELEAKINKKNNVANLKENFTKNAKKKQLREMEYMKKNSESSKQVYLNFISGLIVLNYDTLGVVSKDDVYRILKPYFKSYPEVKKIYESL